MYAPEAIIHIRTAPNSRGKGKIIDVTEDCTEGSITRVLNGISTSRFTLLNQSRKYEGMFSPMDTVTIYLRRIKTVLKFSGYLDAVPLWAATQGSITLRASCSLKRLQNFYWDPTSAPAVELLNRGYAADTGATRMNDGGLAQRAINVLTEVAQWPQGQIHIARVPENWYDRVSKVADQLIAEAEALQMASVIGSGAWVNGQNPVSGGAASVEGVGPGTGVMPATSGKISYFGGPGGGAYGNFALTGESGTRPTNPWYCAMRWPYVSETLKSIPGVNVDQAKGWWRNRKILVVNPRTGKAVVLRAADWGPNISTGRAIDVSPTAIRALGANTDDVVHMGFAPENANLGPISGSDAGLGLAIGSNTGSASGAQGISDGWGMPGDESNMVQAHAAGITFTVHRLAKTNFEGFVNDLVHELGYHPKVIGGYYDRNIAGTSRKSNHAWGAAIDIDPEQNKRYGSAAGGPYALPKPPAIINLARKWGLGWGGEWHNSKDYMHFEVIGAPASDTYDGVSGSGTGMVIVAKWKPPIHGSYTVTTRFGDGGNRWASGTHSGTDFACPEGTNIYPVGPGTVFDKGSGDASYGNWVAIDHGNKVYTFYAHMNAASPVPVGTAVTTNTVIGYVGQTGNATGPHVHVELRKGANTYTAATRSGGIEKYVLGGANRSDPPAGVQTVEGDITSAGTSGLDVATVGQGLFNVFQYNLAQMSAQGTMLGGYRALLNDEPVLATVEEFMTAGLRDFSSAPNGDFIAWFPDYFGHYKQAGKMIVSPLEINLTDGPPTVGWSDENLKTHQFVSSASFGTANDASELWRTSTTAGIASVEFPELMMALFDISRKQAEDMRDEYLSRYGARPAFRPMNNISGSRQEFFFACMEFMRNWSQQYQAQVNLTFMPELYPGMLACFPAYGIQAYVRETTDSWSMTGGFSTNFSGAPWSTIGNSPKAPAHLPKGAAL